VKKQPATSNLHTYLTYERLLLTLIVSVVLILNTLANGINASLEFLHHYPNEKTWQPWSWEISSALPLVILFPLLILFTKRYPLHWGRFGQQLLRHLLASLAFSGLHIGAMVWLRTHVYGFHGMDYQFDFGLWNLIYEYLKDVRTYILLCAIIELYRFVMRRWQGEAAMLGPQEIDEDCEEQKSLPTYVEQILVKKLDREFLLKTNTIEWITSEGNYQMLHVKGHDYPLRSTQQQLQTSLDPTVFIKAGRGLILNINFIGETRHQKGGELKIILKNGREFLITKTWRDKIPAHLRTVIVE